MDRILRWAVKPQGQWRSISTELSPDRHRFNDTTSNTAVTETASEILGKHRQKKKPWITAEILDLCDKTRELRKRRFKPEGSEKYKEVNNNIRRCMKKAKENWIGEQRVVRLKKIWGRTTVRGHTNWWKTWPLWNRGKRLLFKFVQESASQKSDR